MRPIRSWIEIMLYRYCPKIDTILLIVFCIYFFLLFYFGIKASHFNSKLCESPEIKKIFIIFCGMLGIKLGSLISSITGNFITNMLFNIIFSLFFGWIAFLVFDLNIAFFSFLFFLANHFAVYFVNQMPAGKYGHSFFRI